MKKIFNLYFLIIFYLVISFVQITAAIKTYIIEDDDLCSLVTKRKIKLPKGERSALRVSQKRLNDHSITWLNHIHCKFEIQTSFMNGGVIAVIQYLNLRKERNSGDCIDYVEFKGKGETGQRSCGKINGTIIMDQLYEDPDKNPRISYSNAFVDVKGELDVIIHIDKLVPEDWSEPFDIDIVFTSYKDCSGWRKGDEIDLKPCSEEYNHVCIDKHFFNDHHINCPFFGCVDEGGCLAQTPPVAPKSVGNKVLIGSVSALFIMFGVFVLCVWSCRRHKIFCWSEDFANPTLTPQDASNRNSRVMEMNEQTGARLATTTANVIATAPEADKDLPPSYDSLFPEPTDPHR